MSDDALGLEALARLESAWELPPQVDVLDGGTLGLDLLVHVEGYGGMLVLDAVSRGAEPGAVHRIPREEAEAALATSLSPHQVGIADLFALLELLGRTPARLTVIGVEPGCVELGLDLTPAVAAAVGRAADLAAEELRSWGMEVEPREAPPGQRGGRDAAR